MTPPTDTLYIDGAAATALDPRVLSAMGPYWSEHIANAGALHSPGAYAQQVIEEARRDVAQTIGAQPDEVIFTSGGTESNNLAIQGLVRAYREQGKESGDLHLVTCAIEHSSVLDCYRALEREGIHVTVVPVDRDGVVNLRELEQALTAKTILVSIILANNEIGTIEPLADVARIVRRAREVHGAPAHFHTDASQAPAWLPCSVAKLGVDLMTLDAQKIYGPKGAGCLYRRRGVPLSPLMYGGKQEFGLRPGTPPTPLIVGFAKAMTIVEEEREGYVHAVAAVRDSFISAVTAAIPDAELNGASGSKRLSNNVNLSFPGLEGEQIVIELDARGIAASTRSACLKGTSPGSYMVEALGKDNAHVRGAVRFSFSRHTTLNDADRAAQSVIEIVRRLKNC